MYRRLSRGVDIDAKNVLMSFVFNHALFSAMLIRDGGITVGPLAMQMKTRMAHFHIETALHLLDLTDKPTFRMIHLLSPQHNIADVTKIIRGPRGVTYFQRDRARQNSIRIDFINWVITRVVFGHRISVRNRDTNRTAIVGAGVHKIRAIVPAARTAVPGVDVSGKRTIVAQA